MWKVGVNSLILWVQFLRGKKKTGGLWNGRKGFCRWNMIWIMCNTIWTLHGHYYSTRARITSGPSWFCPETYSTDAKVEKKIIIWVPLPIRLHTTSQLPSKVGRTLYVYKGNISFYVALHLDNDKLYILKLMHQILHAQLFHDLFKKKKLFHNSYNHLISTNPF